METCLRASIASNRTVATLYFSAKILCLRQFKYLDSYELKVCARVSISVKTVNIITIL